MRTTHIIICPGCQTEVDVNAWVRDPSQDGMAIGDDTIMTWRASYCPGCHHYIRQVAKGMLQDEYLSDTNGAILFTYPYKDNY